MGGVGRRTRRPATPVAVRRQRGLARRPRARVTSTGPVERTTTRSPSSAGVQGRHRPRLGGCRSSGPGRRCRGRPRAAPRPARPSPASGVPGPEPHQVLPLLGRRRPRRGDGVPGGRAPALPALGVDARGPRGRPATSSTTSPARSRGRLTDARPGTPPCSADSRGGEHQRDRGRGVGGGVLGLAVLRRPRTSARPSPRRSRRRTRRPVSATARAPVPSSSSSRSESSSTLPRSVPSVPCTQNGQPGSRGDRAADDPHRRGGAAEPWPATAWPTTGCGPRRAGRARGESVACTAGDRVRRRRRRARCG